MLKISVFEEREISYEMNEQVNECLRLDPGRSLLKNRSNLEEYGLSS